jgi:CBS domain-containing protein
MKVDDVMTPLIVSVSADAPVAAAARLMRSNAVGFLRVREGGRLVGIVTDRDITVRAAAGGLDPESVRVEEVMTPAVVTMDAGTRADEALRVMEGAGVSRLLVVDARGQAVGVLSDHDIPRPPAP